MAAPLYRIKFDVPHNYAIEPGYARAQHSHDFREEAGKAAGTFRDPLTGLIMLQPSYLQEAGSRLANFKLLSGFLKDATFWKTVHYGIDAITAYAQASQFSTILPQGSDFSANSLETALVSVISRVGVSLATTVSDTMVWALQSSFSLARDEGFCMHIKHLSPETSVFKNWFYIVFDRYGIHFSTDGYVRVWEYQGALSDPPTKIDEFQFCSPGDLSNRDLFFVFLPIPGHGLALYSSRSAQRLDARNTSAQQGVGRGAHLIKIIRGDASAGFYVHDGGAVSVACASGLIYGGFRCGFEVVRYDTEATATFTDAPFDPGYKPSFDPFGVTAITVPADPSRGTVTAALRKADDSGAWVAGTDRQGRVRVSLSTADARYTPFVLGTFVRWQPYFQTRATTAIQPTRLFGLEFTQDDLARSEGVARCFHRTTLDSDADAQRRLVDRGDTTWQIEQSLDAGDSYDTLTGGLAQVSRVGAFLDFAGMYYLAEWRLTGQEARFDEITQTMDTAFDAVSIKDAINVVLESCGFPTLHTPVPADADQTLPPVLAGQTFRYQTKQGDRGDAIIKQLLLYLRRQFVEYRIRYDWAAQRFVLETKPRDTSAGATWRLTPYPDEHDPDNRVVYIGDGTPHLWDMTVTPPEANMVQAFGVSSADHRAYRVPSAPLVNVASIGDPTSDDYLGRVKIAYPLFAPVYDGPEINRMARRFYDAVCRRRLQLTVPCRVDIPGLTPGLQVIVRGPDSSGDRADLLTLWLKRRTLAFDFQTDGNVVPQVTYFLDSIWESDLDQ
jgi:hypothetical protein